MLIDQPPPRFSGLKTRTLSALAMLAVALTSELLGGLWFAALVLIASLLMIREWDRLTNEDGVAWKIGGLAYIAAPCLALLWLRGTPEGLELVLALLMIVWATDIGAYFSGRALGGPKLIPSISPNKTWAGLLGGMAAAALTSMLCTSFATYPATSSGAIILGLVLAVVAQAGDFFESWMKRRAGVKDSGTLIPGHGGLLDRVDGLMFAAPLFAVLVWLAA